MNFSGQKLFSSDLVLVIYVGSHGFVCLCGGYWGGRFEGDG